jgi:hypothetical protein
MWVNADIDNLAPSVDRLVELLLNRYRITTPLPVRRHQKREPHWQGILKEISFSQYAALAQAARYNFSA